MSNIVIRPKDRAEWKPIVGFQGLYEVSSLGEIKSIARLVNNGKETKRHALLVNYSSNTESECYFKYSYYYECLEKALYQVLTYLIFRTI